MLLLNSSCFWTRLYKKYYPMSTQLEAKSFLCQERLKLDCILYSISIEYILEKDAELEALLSDCRQKIYGDLHSYDAIALCQEIERLINQYANKKIMDMAYTEYLRSIFNLRVRLPFEQNGWKLVCCISTLIGFLFGSIAVSAISSGVYQQCPELIGSVVMAGMVGGFLILGSALFGFCMQIHKRM